MDRVEIEFLLVSRSDSDENPNAPPPTSPSLGSRVVNLLPSPALWPMIKSIGEAPTRTVSGHSQAIYQALADSLVPTGMKAVWVASAHKQRAGIWASPPSGLKSHLFRLHHSGEGDPTFRTPLTDLQDRKSVV